MSPESPLVKDKKLRFKVLALIFVLFQLPLLGLLLHPRVQDVLGRQTALGFLALEVAATLAILAFLWILLNRRHR